MRFAEQHRMIAETTQKFVESEINPYCDEWEAEGKLWTTSDMQADWLCALVCKIDGTLPSPTASRRGRGWDK